MKFPTVREYYNKKESKWGYFFVMGQSQHLGFYDDRDNSTNLREKEAQKKLHDQLVKYLKPSHTDKILDIGCGQGFVASDLAKRYNLNIIGIDITPYMTKRAQRYSKRKGVSEKTSFLVQDYNNTTLPDNTFDYIYAVETLCHSPNLRKTLKELHRILKPGGKFISLEYTLNPSKLRGTEYEDSFYKTISKYTASPSLYLFESNSFTRIVTDSGFELVEKIDVTNNCFPSIKRLTQLAKFPYFIIKKLHLEKKFINTWIGANWQTVVELGYWGFMHRIYKKPKK